MQNEVPLGMGGMAAVIAMDADKIAEICENTPGKVQIANYNCPGQIVISGEALDAHLMEMKELYIKSDEKDAIRKHLDGELDTIENRIDSLDKRITIREQMSEIIDLIPISYIAKNYFGKSRAWLYQRINGYKVRGRVYSLNEKEVETFNRALKDISHKIGSLSVS